MRERFRSFDSKISFFAFADIITAVSGMLIFITLLLATDLGRPTDNRSQAANSELDRQLQETLRQQAAADAENRGLQNLLATANTAPDPDKLKADISRLQTELADEKSKHVGMAEQLAASKTNLEERDKIVGITAVRQHIQEGTEELAALAREDEKIRDETAALEQKISSTQSRIVKLHKREGQMWLIPDRSTTAKEPILVIVSGRDLKIEHFDQPDLTQQFDKSGAHAGFASFLKHAKPANQYIVFLIRPSGIGLFRDIVEAARANNFEVGFDALEEDREIHFTRPPPIDDEAVPQKRPENPGTVGAPPGNPGAPAITNRPGNPPPAAATGTATATNAATAAGATNSVPPPPPGQPAPPPPKPKSWWQRLLEWIGIG